MSLLAVSQLLLAPEVFRSNVSCQWPKKTQIKKNKSSIDHFQTNINIICHHGIASPILCAERQRFYFYNVFSYFFVSTLDPDRCPIDGAARASLCSHMEPTSNVTGSISFPPFYAQESDKPFAQLGSNPARLIRITSALKPLQKLFSSLMTDHRHAVEVELESHDESYFAAIRREDPRVLTCDFCDQVHLKAP